ncbi:MAG: methionyl-tRNA formyltransferase, partial [Firmicutes bacterium]|nr:methionyl-tRNA formyltransferase [Bacillota bacterium]
MRVVYFGTPDFAVPSLRALIDAGFDVPLVVTRPDQQRDRGKKLKPTPVKALAEEAGIPVVSPETLKRVGADGRVFPGEADKEVMKLLKEAKPDCIVVAAYGQILPNQILDLPRLGCVNVPGSLLPRWRGAAPVQRAIEAGDETTGVTIMYM